MAGVDGICNQWPRETTLTGACLRRDFQIGLTGKTHSRVMGATIYGLSPWPE